MSTSALRSVSEDTWHGLAVLVLIVGLVAAIGMVRAGRDRRRQGQSQPGFLALGKLITWACLIAAAGVAVAYAKVHGWAS